MKKHLLNRCQNCGHTWFPQGFDLSRKCPNCDSADVDFAGRLYLVMLVVIALGAGIFWATDRPHRSAQKMATPASTPALAKLHRSAPVIPAAHNAIPGPITTETEGRREALRLYPDLGVAGSALNTEFVNRYRSYQRLDPDFFQNPAWPLVLVKESAAALGEQKRAP